MIYKSYLIAGMQGGVCLKVSHSVITVIFIEKIAKCYKINNKLAWIYEDIFISKENRAGRRKHTVIMHILTDPYF